MKSIIKCELCIRFYLRSNLCSLLRIHHADMFKVFQSVLPVLLLSPHILLQQAEDMARLQQERARQMVKSSGRTVCCRLRCQCIRYTKLKLKATKQSNTTVLQ